MLTDQIPILRLVTGNGFPVTNTGEGGHLMAVHYLVLLCFGLFSVNTLLGLDGLLGLSLDHVSP